MRRRRIMLAGVVAVASAGAWSGVASADRLAGGGFCSTVEEAIGDLRDASPGSVDPTDPEAVQQLYEEAADLYRDLGKKAPKKLKSSFKTVGKFFRSLSEIDLTDPEEARSLPTQSRKTSKAFAKVAGYLADDCGLDPSDLEGVGGG